jgi:hypothetical protein
MPKKAEGPAIHKDLTEMTHGMSKQQPTPPAPRVI